MSNSIFTMSIALTLLVSLFFCNCKSQQNVLNQDDVYFVDSLGTNKIYFHRNMSLVDSLFYTQIDEVGKTLEGFKGSCISRKDNT